MSEAVQWEGQKILKLATTANVEAMKKATLFLEGEVKKVLSRAGTGRTYKRKSVTHRASVAGKPPALDIGVLMNSMTGVTEVKGLEIQGFVGSDLDKIAAKSDVGTDLEYGYYLEVGTKNMSPRPFLRPTLRVNGKKILEFFKKANK